MLGSSTSDPGLAALVAHIQTLEAAGAAARAAQLVSAYALPPERCAELAFEAYRHRCYGVARVLTRDVLERVNSSSAEACPDSEASLSEASLSEASLSAACIAAHVSLGTGDAELGRRALAILETYSRERLAPFRTSVGVRLREEVVVAANAERQAAILERLPLLRLLEPEIARVLTVGAEEQSPDWACGDASRVMDFAGPPPGTPRRPRTAVVALLERTHPDNPESRRHEIGPLITAALTSYGWRAEFYGLSSLGNPDSLARDYMALAHLCLARGADALFIQEFREDGLPDAGAVSLIAHLRQTLPALRIIGVYLDSWRRETWDALIRTAPLLDRLWSVFPALEVWRHPALLGKTLLVPFPHEAGTPRLRPSARPGTMLSFVGGVDAANWHRGVWWAALKEAGVPVRFAVTRRVEDGLDALSSSNRYLRHLGGTGAALNFSSRRDGTRIVTGRAFEILMTGALLVQEDTPDMDYYFVRGRHYLGFSSLASLMACARALPEAAERVADIRTEGFAFFRERYSDAAISAYLDQSLFGATADFSSPNEGGMMARSGGPRPSDA